MERHIGKLVINRMTGGRDRVLPALAPGRADIDARSVAEVLAQTSRFAGLVRFIAADDQPDGDWSDFFLADPTLVLASIAAAELEAVEAGHADLRERLLETRDEQRKLDRFSELFAEIVALARLVDRWQRGLATARPGRASAVVQRAVSTAIAGPLSEQLNRLRAHAEAAAQPSALGHAIAVDTTSLSSAWQLHGACVSPNIYHGHDRRRRIDRALPVIDDVFMGFVNELALLRGLAQTHLDASLAEATHAPHAALCIAFGRLFANAQATLNRFPDRFTEFYYREVLQMTPRGPVGDSLFVVLALAPSKAPTSVLVPAGTRFSAGRDLDGLDLVYASEKDARVCSGRLTRVRTLHVTSAPLLPADTHEMVVQRMLATSVVAGAAPFAPFGRVGERETSATPATLGFAVATPALLLSGGHRTVKLKIRFTAAAAATLSRRLAQLAAAANISPVDVLRQVLCQGLALDLSTAHGWLACDNWVGVVHDDALEARKFALELALPPSWPAIAAIGPGSTEPATASPTLRGRLVQNPLRLGSSQVEVYPLSVLADLELESITLRTRVVDLPIADLTTASGSVGTRRPLSVFGATPGVGSFLDIYHPELFIKRLDSVGLRIDWFDLPTAATGFAGYYHDYVIGASGPLDRPLDNRAFQVSLGVINPGSWDLGKDATRLFLFRTDPTPNPPDEPTPDGALDPTTTLGPFPPLPESPPAYHDPTRSRLRLTLVGPREGFGDLVYAQNVLVAVTTRRAVEPVGAPPPSPALRYPNRPWAPRAERVSVSYVSSVPVFDRTAPSTSVMTHLLPFDETRPLAPSPDGHATFLPGVAAGGALMLDVAGVPPSDTLTLLVQVAPTGDASTADWPQVTWQHRTGGAWLPLARVDETLGLRRTGLLHLGPAVEPPTAVHTSGTRHYRATVAAGSERFPEIVAIHMNGLLTRWQNRGNSGEHLREPRPRGAVHGSLDKLAGIQTIDQPMPSFGGRPPESAAELSLRLAERLRHKERAIVGWDYERLVLERFPTIMRVRVLPATDARGRIAPGEVTIVVLPCLDDLMDPTAPTLGGDALSGIAETLAQVTSPFVTIHVVNPVYVRITVIARVAFTSDRDPAASARRLDAELVQVLSPAGDACLGVSGRGYADHDDIAEFVRTRPYVDALLHLEFSYSPDPHGLEWYFLTSATRHSIKPVDISVDQPEDG